MGAVLALFDVAVQGQQVIAAVARRHARHLRNELVPEGHVLQQPRACARTKRGVKRCVWSGAVSTQTHAAAGGSPAAQGLEAHLPATSCNLVSCYLRHILLRDGELELGRRLYRHANANLSCSNGPGG